MKTITIRGTVSILDSNSQVIQWHEGHVAVACATLANSWVEELVRKSSMVALESTVVKPTGDTTIKLNCYGTDILAIPKSVCRVVKLGHFSSDDPTNVLKTAKIAVDQGRSVRFVVDEVVGPAHITALPSWETIGEWAMPTAVICILLCLVLGWLFGARKEMTDADYELWEWQNSASDRWGRP